MNWLQVIEQVGSHLCKVYFPWQCLQELFLSLGWVKCSQTPERWVTVRCRVVPDFGDSPASEIALSIFCRVRAGSLLALGSPEVDMADSPKLDNRDVGKDQTMERYASEVLVQQFGKLSEKLKTPAELQDEQVWWSKTTVTHMCAYARACIFLGPVSTRLYRDTHVRLRTRVYIFLGRRVLDHGGYPIVPNFRASIRYSRYSSSKHFLGGVGCMQLSVSYWVILTWAKSSIPSESVVAFTQVTAVGIHTTTIAMAIMLVNHAFINVCGKWLKWLRDLLKEISELNKKQTFSEVV